MDDAAAQGASSDDSAPSLPPDIEEYQLLRLLGRGAMGEVYLAHDTALDRRVAVKLIAGIDPDARARQRFFFEARALARVHHPNVVAVFRVGEARRRPYLVSELVDGESLDREHKPMPPERVVAIATGLARGLAAVHRQGLLHRDIKPANVMLAADGAVKLLDFGLAELRERDPHAPEISPEIKPEEPHAAPARTAPDEGETLSQITMDVGGGGPSAPCGGDPRNAPPLRSSPSADETAPPRAAAPAEEPRAAPAKPAGTPLYMAPELWRGLPASPRSDVYALGSLLYEIASGEAPLAGASLADLPRASQRASFAPLAERAPGLDPAFARVVDRCLALDPDDRFASGDALCDALEALAAPRASSLPGAPDPLADPAAESPYRGLSAFDARHRSRFFGRAAETRALLDRVRADPFVLVTGDSGIGKSSLCRAGLAPLLAREGPAGGPGWLATFVVPGKRPVAALSSALAPALALPEDDVERALRADPDEIGRRLRQRPGTLVVVDQLEELLTLADPAEQSLAARALAGMLVGAPSVRLVATARADFLTRLTALPELGREIARSLFLVGAMGPGELREAIVEPARAEGFRFESDDTVTALAGAALAAPGGLPLLQFTLAQLWRLRDPERRVIPASALASLGGAEGALARHADGVIEALLPAARAAARRVLVALVTSEGTRARRSLRDLAPGHDPAADAAARAALDALVRERILVARSSDEGDSDASHGADPEGGATYEIAHEALVTRWDTLRDWLRRDEGALALRRRIERAAAEWTRLGEHTSALWSHVQLAELRDLDLATLGARERRFLAAARRARRRRLAAVAAAVALVPAIPLAAYTIAGARSRAEIDRSVAALVDESSRSEADAHRIDAEAATLRERALALYRAEGRRRGDEAWSEAHERALLADQAYDEASRDVERALALRDDPALRARIGDLTLARFFLADTDARPEDRDALRFRLSLFDADGSRRAAIAAGGHLSLTTDPPGAFTLRRFDRKDALMIEGAPLREGQTDHLELDLEQGSYLLDITAPGRAPVRAPFLVRRADRVALSFKLPLSSDVPPGFVFVPRGPFLTGSDQPGIARSESFQAMPLHRADIDSFLIARDEVTFADWIAYLDSLSPEERDRRRPHGRDEEERLDLVLLSPGARPARAPGAAPDSPPPAAAPSRWRLTFDDPRLKVHYTAVSGEPFVGRDGKLGAWERFPVSSISQDDALAYTRWLDATGKVPGARVCNELEWEKAARGADGRRYPKGDRLALEDANISPVDGHDPDGYYPAEVGSHPASRSVFGVDDTSGNVAEMTVSVLEHRRMSQKSGTWYQGLFHARIDRRQVLERPIRHPRVGFRVCATPR